jgi:IclR family acetate operon transcriptional repressor
MSTVSEGSQAIDRAARILVRLVESDDALTLSGVVEETRLPKTTAARLLRALERNGLAQRRRGGGFRPGPVLVEYARRDAAVGDLGTLAHPFLERLGAATGETANIAIPTPTGVARLAQVDSNHPLGAGNWVGRRIPIHASSMGKVFMAFGAAQPPFGRLARLGPNTITSMSALLAELEQVRRVGFATTWEELVAGLCSTAAPVRGARGSVIAAISVSAPTVRTTRERLLDVAQQVVVEADALSGLIRLNHPEGVRGA